MAQVRSFFKEMFFDVRMISKSIVMAVKIGEAIPPDYPLCAPFNAAEFEALGEPAHAEHKAMAG